MINKNFKIKNSKLLTENNNESFKKIRISNYNKTSERNIKNKNIKVLDMIKNSLNFIEDNKKSQNFNFQNAWNENKKIFKNYKSVAKNKRNENYNKIYNFFERFKKNNTTIKKIKINEKKLTKKWSWTNNYLIDNYKLVKVDIKNSFYKPDNIYLSKLELCKVKNNYFCILIGGVSNNLKESIFYYNIALNSWQKYDYNFNGLEYSRYGFSIFSINNHKDIIIFGGKKNKDFNLYSLYLNDSIIINLEKNIYKKLKLKTDIIPKQRKFNLYCTFNNSIVIYGGEDKNQNYLNDLWMGNINNLTYQISWTKYFFTEDKNKIKETRIILGAMDSIKKNKTLDTLKFSSNLLDYIFIFGGINQLNICNNNLKKINIKKLYTQIEEIKPNGLYPEPRFSHIFKYNKIINGIILYGGKNIQNKIFNDFFVYNFIKNDWIELKIFKTQITNERYNCSMIFFKNYIYIFGGINYDGLIDSNFLNYRID